MKAVILAAGKGTRMRELTADRPKHLLPLADRPVLEHIVLAIAKSGIRDFILVTGHYGQLIQEHFGDGSRLGLRFHYLRQEKLDGTGSAVRLAREAVGDSPFLLALGDILVAPDNYARMVANFEANPCEGMLTLWQVDDPCRGAAVYLDDQMRVLKIIEKPAPGTSTTNWNNAGLFVFTPKLFEYTARLTPSPRGEYELPQAIQAMIADDRVIRGFPLTGFWSDIGTPEDLARFEALLKEQPTCR